MKKFIKFCAPVIAVALTGIAAQAAQIVGTVNMGGNVTLNSMNLGSATAATAFNSVMAQGGVGSSYGITQEPATMSPFTWSPTLFLVNPLWQFTTPGGETFAFDLQTLTSVVVAPDDSQITLKGTGTVTGTGAINYDPTTANWIFSIVDSATTPGGGMTFNFGFTQSDTASAATPDGAMTLSLLGGALSGLALIKRKLA